jgi:hypothetical protein
MILKETLYLNDEVQTVSAGEVLHVSQQNDLNNSIQIWFEDKYVRDRRFTVHGTGHPVEINEVYKGTYVNQTLGLVWHVFQVVD